MIPEVSKFIQDLVHHTVNALNQKDTARLRRLSDQAIQEASIHQDEDSVTYAVIIYSLAKILQRNEESDSRQLSKFIQKCTMLLKKIRTNLENKDQKLFRQHLKRMFQFIERMDDKIPLYTQEIIEKARINKGSLLYEQGLSSAKTSDLLGISQWQLINYIGHTQINERSPEGIPIKERLLFAKKVFDVK